MLFITNLIHMSFFYYFYLCDFGLPLPFLLLLLLLLLFSFSQLGPTHFVFIIALVTLL